MWKHLWILDGYFGETIGQRCTEMWCCQSSTNVFRLKWSRLRESFSGIPVSSTPFLKDDQILRGLSRLSLGGCETLFDKDCQIKLKHVAAASRNPVILILDSGVQSLPWKSLPIKSKNLQAASRILSLPLWSALKYDTASVVSSDVAKDKNLA